MSDVEQIFSDLLDARMSAEAVTEANDRTLPGGTYRLDIVKKSVETASDKSPWPGRFMVRVQADAAVKNGDGEWTRKGRLFFDLSPEEHRDARNRLDPPARLWANMVGVVGRGASNREVLDYIGQYPLFATVSRPFKTLEGKWSNPRTPEDEDKLLKEGAEPRNFVQTLRTFNG